MEKVSVTMTKNHGGMADKSVWLKEGQTYELDSALAYRLVAMGRAELAQTPQAKTPSAKRETRSRNTK